MPPAGPRRRLRALARIAALAAALAIAGVAARVSAGATGVPAWTTWHADPARTGVAAADAPAPFARAWATPALDGPVYASPLVYGNRVYVATEANTVYALDAATGAVVWHSSAGTPVDAAKLPCGNISPTVGITSTPVIDPATSTIYAVADTWTGSTARHVLVGYDLATGAARFPARQVDPPGANTAGGDSTLALLQRSSLNLFGGRVVFGYGGNAGDCGAYHGWVVSAPEDPTQATAFYKVPTHREGAVWAPGGVAIAPDGTIYAATGNGDDTTTYDHGDSVVELSPSLTELGYFASPTWAHDNLTDADLGSATPALLGNGLLFQAGKNGNGYLVSTDLSGHPGPAYQAPACRSFGGDAYDGTRLYVSCADGVRALSVAAAPPSFAILWHGPSDAKGSPIVAGGLVWSIAYDSGVLYGLDPATGAVKVSAAIPVAQHFATPAAAGGRLFVAAGTSVIAYTIGASAGAPTPTPTPTPKPQAKCPARVTFRMPHRRHRHIVSVRTQVDRGKIRRAHIRRSRVTVAAPRNRRTFTARVFVNWSDGRKVAFSRHYEGCVAGKLRKRVLHR